MSHYTDGKAKTQRPHLLKVMHEVGWKALSFISLALI